MSQCPLCNQKRVKDYIKIKNKTYKKCINCSLVFLENTGEENKIYTNEYIIKRCHNILNSSIIEAKKITSKYYLSFLKKYNPCGKLLEIGCSTGISLKVAKDMGWEVYGLDINKSAVDIARKFLNTDTIKTGELKKDMFPDNFFSVVLMFDVLEHIPEPNKYIKIINEKLKKNGFLLIITPNIFSLSGKILKNKWYHLFPEHLCLYSKKSIKFLLEKYGFKILKIGWAIKFVNFEMLKLHLQCHPDLFLSKILLPFLKKINLKIVFPFNIGEMYILAVLEIKNQISNIKNQKLKYEIRSTKYETKSKFKNQNDKKET